MSNYSVYDGLTLCPVCRAYGAAGRPCSICEPFAATDTHVMPTWITQFRQALGRYGMIVLGASAIVLLVSQCGNPAYAGDQQVIRDAQGRRQAMIDKPFDWSEHRVIRDRDGRRIGTVEQVPNTDRYVVRDPRGRRLLEVEPFEQEKQ